MAENEVKIFFKVDGIDGYITDLNELQAALAKTDTETKDLSASQEKLDDTTKENITTLNSLNENLNKLQRELAETEVGSDAFVKLQGKIKDAEEALDDAKKGTESFGGALGDVPGPVGNITKGVKGLGTALKALLANPIVLVIAGVVAAVTALYKAFTSTREGGEAVDRVLAGLSAAFQVITDRVAQLAGAIVQFFQGDFTGAFETAKGAVSGIGAEIAKEAAETARLTGVLQKSTKDLQALNVERAQQNALLAESKLKIDDTSLSIEERQEALEKAGAAETALLEKELALEQERLDALLALSEFSSNSVEDDEEIAQARIKIAQLEEQSLNKQTELLGKRKALVAEQAAADKAAADEAARLRKEREDAAAKQLEQETAIAEELRRRKLDEEALELDDLRIKYEEQVKLAGKNEKLIADLKTQYDADVAASKKKFDDERIAAEEATQKTIKDVLDKYAEVKYATEEQRILAELEQKYTADRAILEAEGATKEQLAQLDKAYQDKVTAQTKKGEADREKLRKDNILKAVELTQGVFGALQALNDARTADDEREAKKQFERNKKYSIAQALISTGLAVNAALTAGGNPIKLATGAQFVEAGIALATGLAQVAKIKATKFESSGDSGGDNTIEQPRFNPQASIDFTNQQLGGLQNAGEEINLGQAGSPSAPIRAYVVATEVSSQQEANNQVENLSRL